MQPPGPRKSWISDDCVLPLAEGHANRRSAGEVCNAPLSGGILFPLQSPFKAWLQRWRPYGACCEKCSGQASHIRGASLSRFSSITQNVFCAGRKDGGDVRPTAVYVLI